MKEFSLVQFELHIVVINMCRMTLTMTTNGEYCSPLMTGHNYTVHYTVIFHTLNVFTNNCGHRKDFMKKKKHKYFMCIK